MGHQHWGRKALWGPNEQTEWRCPALHHLQLSLWLSTYSFSFAHLLTPIPTELAFPVLEHIGMLPASRPSPELFLLFGTYSLDSGVVWPPHFLQVLP